MHTKEFNNKQTDKATSKQVHILRVLVIQVEAPHMENCSAKMCICRKLQYENYSFKVTKHVVVQMISQVAPEMQAGSDAFEPGSLR